MAEDNWIKGRDLEALVDPRSWVRALRQSRFDLSSLGLIGANLVSITMAIVQGWNLAVLMWVYWAQSIIIGMFNFCRILSLREFSTEGVRVSGDLVDPTPQTKVGTACFFAMHYGFFHVAYCFSLADDLPIPSADLGLIGLCAVTFFVNHAFSFFYNRARDRSRRPNVGTMMLLPYARVIPMHLMIFLGVFLARGVAGMIIFFILKTVADLIMHMAEHSRSVPWAADARDT